MFSLTLFSRAHSSLPLSWASANPTRAQNHTYTPVSLCLDIWSGFPCGLSDSGAADEENCGDD